MHKQLEIPTTSQIHCKPILTCYENEKKEKISQQVVNFRLKYSKTGCLWLLSTYISFKFKFSTFVWHTQGFEFKFVYFFQIKTVQLDCTVYYFTG